MEEDKTGDGAVTFSVNGEASELLNELLSVFQEKRLVITVGPTTFVNALLKEPDWEECSPEEEVELEIIMDSKTEIIYDLQEGEDVYEMKNWLERRPLYFHIRIDPDITFKYDGLSPMKKQDLLEKYPAFVRYYVTEEED